MRRVVVTETPIWSEPMSQIAHTIGNLLLDDLQELLSLEIKSASVKNKLLSLGGRLFALGFTPERHHVDYAVFASRQRRKRQRYPLCRALHCVNSLLTLIEEEDDPIIIGDHISDLVECILFYDYLANECARLQLYMASDFLSEIYNLEEEVVSRIETQFLFRLSPQATRFIMNENALVSQPHKHHYDSVPLIRILYDIAMYQA